MNADEFDKQWEEAEEGEKDVEEAFAEIAETIPDVKEIMEELTKDNHKDEDDEKFINQKSYLVIEE